MLYFSYISRSIPILHCILSFIFQRTSYFNCFDIRNDKNNSNTLSLQYKSFKTLEITELIVFMIAILWFLICTIQ